VLNQCGSVQRGLILEGH